MNDSEDKVITTPAVGVSEEIVLHPKSGTPVKVNRSASGKFAKQKKTMPKTEDVTRLMRNLMIQSKAGLDGKMRKGDPARIRLLFDNLFTIAEHDSRAPVLDKFGNAVMYKNDAGELVPLLTFDAKSAMASAKAAEVLFTRIYGAPSKSEEEIDALKTQGVKIVVITPPEHMMNKQITEEKPKPTLKPSFIEGEFAEDKG